MLEVIPSSQITPLPWKHVRSLESAKKCPMNLRDKYSGQESFGLLNTGHTRGHRWWDYNIKISNGKMDLVMWHFAAKINENFPNKYHQMQRTCNYYFELKQCDINLHQMKINKHECDKEAPTWKTKENGKIKHK